MRVIIESPYSGDIERNECYARRCLHDSLMRGEAPFASHLLYTQPGVLDDEIPEQRKTGMEAAWYWMAVADLVVVYNDYGITTGMKEGVEMADTLSVRVDYRQIGVNP